jgi:hypothetical protein
MDYTALASEINTDPAGLGYAALKASGSDGGISTLINTPTTTLINRGTIPIEDFLFAFGFIFDNVSSITDANVKAAWAWSLSIVKGTNRVNLASVGVNGDTTAVPPVNGVRQKAVLSGICTDAQWAAIAYQPASRAEILWGVGVVVQHQDVARALRG